MLSSKISGCTFSGHVANASVDAEPPPVSPSAKVIVCVMQTTSRSQNADQVDKYIEKLRSEGIERGEERRGEERRKSEEGKKGDVEGY